jgi:hypothetical protein
MTKLGIDFDNTLVSYDQLFHEIAVEQGLIPAELPRSKEVVRDHLRAENREEQWTLIQGHVYGTCMSRASLFDGAFAALSLLASWGWEIVIVSHKTKVPFLGPAYDLHAAAQDFLRTSGLLKPGGPISKACFEISKGDKIKRIAQEGCNAFLDDLPEILLMPGFPEPIRKLLFAPQQTAADLPQGIIQVNCWAEVPAVLQRLYER